MAENDMVRLTPDDFGYAIQVNDELQALIREGGTRLVVGGHTHRPMVRRFENVTVINAGTLVRNQQPSFFVLDVEAGHVTRHHLAADGSVTSVETTPLPATGEAARAV